MIFHVLLQQTGSPVATRTLLSLVVRGNSLCIVPSLDILMYPILRPLSELISHKELRRFNNLGKVHAGNKLPLLVDSRKLFLKSFATSNPPTVHFVIANKKRNNSVSKIKPKKLDCSDQRLE